uniref:Glycosyltransferase subfamily 4-like N-terminal domain-containing protein n=1 Tax=Rhizochromulina marina TaxID=1034831 RepID=A0A7S2W9V3_9STRA
MSAEEGPHLPGEGQATPAGHMSPEPHNRRRKRFRVGLLVEPSPFSHVSGYANRFTEMLRYLREAGDEVAICTPDLSPSAPRTKFGFNVTNLRGFRLPMYRMVVCSFDWRLRTVEVMERFRPDVLHVSTPGFLCIPGMISAWLLNVPLVFSYHTHIPVYARRYFRPFGKISETITWWYLRLIHSQADLTLVTSPQIQEELREKGIARVSIWRKGIDTERYHPKFQDEDMRFRLTGGNPDQPLLVYVGRVAAEKRIEDLKDVLQSIPGARLAIVGGGPQEAALRAHFEGTPTVFTGMLSGEELSQAYASADVFCMPSDSETLGFVVLEAMASGTPVVAVRAGGIPSLIKHGATGLLVEPNAPRRFGAKVRKLLRDKPLRERIAKAARADAETWDWRSSTKDLREVQYAAAMQHHEDKIRHRVPWFRRILPSMSFSFRGFLGEFSLWWNDAIAGPAQPPREHGNGGQGLSKGPS